MKLYNKPKSIETKETKNYNINNQINTQLWHKSNLLIMSDLINTNAQHMNSPMRNLIWSKTDLIVWSKVYTLRYKIMDQINETIN